VVTKIEPTTSGLLDQRRSRSDNEALLTYALILQNNYSYKNPPIKFIKKSNIPKSDIKISKNMKKNGDILKAVKGEKSGPASLKALIARHMGHWKYMGGISWGASLWRNIIIC